MSTAVLAPSAAPSRTGDWLEALRRSAARLADAETEYDAALDRGAAMPVLVRLDQEVAAAARLHRAAQVEAARRV